MLVGKGIGKLFNVITNEYNTDNTQTGLLKIINRIKEEQIMTSDKIKTRKEEHIEDDTISEGKKTDKKDLTGRGPKDWWNGLTDKTYISYKLGINHLYKKYLNEENSKINIIEDIPYSQFLVDIYYSKYNPILNILNIFDSISKKIQVPISTFSNKKYNDYIKLGVGKEVMYTPITSTMGIGGKKNWTRLLGVNAGKAVAGTTHIASVTGLIGSAVGSAVGGGKKSKKKKSKKKKSKKRTNRRTRKHKLHRKIPNKRNTTLKR